MGRNDAVATMNSLARIEPSAIAEMRREPGGAVATTPEELDLIRRTYAKDLTQEEFSLLVADARHRDLDIVKREIVAIKHKGQITIMPTIHGIRKLAERSQHYAGSEGPFWCGPDGRWVEVWLDESQPPAAAKFVVYRDDSAHPIVGIATWKERAQFYYRDGRQVLMPTWAAMPAHMLGKVAETDALKRARLVPSDLPVNLEEQAARAEARAAKITALRLLHGIGSQRGLGHDDVRAVVSAVKPGTSSLAEPSVSSRDLAAAADLIEALDDDAVQAIIDDETAREVEHPAADAITDRTRKAILAAAKKRDVSHDDLHNAAVNRYDADGIMSLTETQAQRLLADVEKIPLPDDSNQATEDEPDGEHAALSPQEQTWLANIAKASKIATLDHITETITNVGLGDSKALNEALDRRLRELTG